MIRAASTTNMRRTLSDPFLSSIQYEHFVLLLIKGKKREEIIHQLQCDEGTYCQFLQKYLESTGREQYV